jgi:Meiotically up-regulated gene 113
VLPVKTYSLVGMNLVKAENLLHRFFSDARLDIEIMDRFGKPFKPREWYMLTLDQIDHAVKLLETGAIINHQYDAKSCSIVPLE